jgi:hypothetical protein
MTERERRTGSGGTEDNVRDELDEATEQGKPDKDASKEAVEEEEQTGGPGGVKDNVKDEWDDSQEHEGHCKCRSPVEPRPDTNRKAGSPFLGGG